MIFYTYRKQKNENFMKKLKRENSDNINQNKKEEREIILNKYIKSTNNYGIKKKINFFENNISLRIGFDLFTIKINKCFSVTVYRIA